MAQAEAHVNLYVTWSQEDGVLAHATVFVRYADSDQLRWCGSTGTTTSPTVAVADGLRMLRHNVALEDLDMLIVA